MHPNYHIHQTPQRKTICKQNLTNNSLHMLDYVKPSFRNSCDTTKTAHTFFTLLEGSSRDSFSSHPMEPFRKETKEMLTTSKDIRSLLNNISSLNSKLQEAKNYLSHGSSRGARSAVGRQDMAKKEIQRSGQDLLQRQVETVIHQSNSKCKELSDNKYKSKLQYYYLKHLLAQKSHNCHQHLEQSHYLLSTFCLEAPEEYQVLNLPCRSADKKKKILVLDLDETLVHCQVDNQEQADFELCLDDENIFVTIRPYALSFIKTMSQFFQIIVFTASEQDYADAVLDQLDPDNLISHRLYRQHCLKLSNNIYTKDLRIINRDPSQMVLIDNSAASFLCQPENSIPILPFEGGGDCELVDLERYLMQLVHENDVRAINRKMFKLEQYRLFESAEELVPKLYNIFSTTIDFQQQC